MTDLERQLKLAAMLPELIELVGDATPNGFDGFYWKKQPNSGEEVTPREWDWIVRECEKRLDADLFMTLVIILGGNKEIENISGGILKSTWQNRADALFETLKEETK